MKRFFILVMCLCMAVPINVCAANQKIKVNPVYQNSKVIKGKTKKRYRVQAKIGKKKYQTKADRKGNFRLRIPKQSVGKSFYIKVYRGKRYILKKKIEKARSLLLETKLSITAIAFQCGFSSSQYFATAFKRFCRMTPSQFRESMKAAKP